ncbi:hypothetical protein RNI52_10575 [Labrys neptuniae]|uniref:Uncharacterized protein n=1 Tax=Labrys neptuniae TaxID=376174 RepID=A0ABV3PGU4_9HYPH|nr:hypothetical protein [Labrys neptuniae]MDT3377763.1 hypothetical protein [Labrys neptuniae]
MRNLNHRAVAPPRANGNRRMIHGDKSAGADRHPVFPRLADEEEDGGDVECLHHHDRGSIGLRRAGSTLSDAISSDQSVAHAPELF